MSKLITSDSLEESIEELNKYIFNGVFCEEPTFYLYQSPSINNYDVEIDYNNVLNGYHIEKTQNNPYTELCALCLPYSIEKPALSDLGYYLISHLQKIDPYITYEFKTYMLNPMLFVSCGDSTISINFIPSLGIITFKNITNVSFNSKQLDLTNISNFTVSKMSNVAKFLENYFRQFNNEKNSIY